MSATMNTTNDGGYQPYCSEHNWADQVFYDFSLACESVDEHNRERHEDVRSTAAGRAELEQINRRQRRALYESALRQAEADYQHLVRDAVTRAKFRGLIRRLQDILKEID
jgi:hypothetical protein